MVERSRENNILFYLPLLKKRSNNHKKVKLKQYSFSRSCLQILKLKTRKQSKVNFILSNNAFFIHFLKHKNVLTAL